MAKRKLKKKAKVAILIFILVVLLSILGVIGMITYKYYQTANQELEPVSQQKEYYNLSDFGFTQLKSKKEYNNDGKDDYQNFLEGAKTIANFNPKYKSEYYANGYPPVEKEGISADLIWYSLKQAGYDLKSMISKDIKNNKKKHFYALIGFIVASLLPTVVLNSSITKLILPKLSLVLSNFLQIIY